MEDHSLWTGAERAGRRLDTARRTLEWNAAVVKAFVVVASGALVGKVGAVGGAVAHLVVRHADTSHSGALPRARRASHIRCDAGVVRGLVRAVAAVVATVTDEALVYTFTIVALEKKSKVCSHNSNPY